MEDESTLEKISARLKIVCSFIYYVSYVLCRMGLK